ncbi:hypothetical protein CDL12_09152 [Handroanthus impetiginosus]|uniref:Uncharacterized protein n=1 Tax=Handroanthus impetiginosus TaxID=429701 RepID=A0A2G9HKZ9_9LAMI|nr:hypothetical protein CDL12_09152 [Handroanthus impetiginosus]
MMLYDLTGCQSLMTDFSQQPFPSSSPPLQDLVYPTRELYLNEPFLDLENAYRPNGQLQYSCSGDKMNDIFSLISDFHSSKHTNKSRKQTMLVPYFQRWRRARGKTDVSKPPTEKVGSPKSHNKTKQKTSRKKKTSTKTGKERDIYSNSYLHACESLLSIIVNKKHQPKSTITSLKKSSPQLPELLTQFSAAIAGTGIAVVLSVFCRVICSRAPFCEAKLLSTGLGLGLVWLSSAVYKLRDTVVSISKSYGTFGEKEDEMMKHLGRNLKDIYFRAFALMVIGVLKVA